MTQQDNLDEDAIISAQADNVDDDYDDGEAKPTYLITSYGADYTVDSLVKRMNQKSFIVPDFQRGFVWSKTHASRFIESLLMGLPVPGIFLYKRPEDGRHLVIDGQQRLKTIQAFYNGMLRDRAFKLHGVRDPWKDKTYSELETEDQLRLDDSIIHAIIFSQDKPEETIDSIHFVFERINSGGVRLSPQEIRNCIAEGPFVKMTADLNASTESWRRIFGPKSQRAKDQELIIRVMAFASEADNYERPMSVFLTKYAQKMNSASIEQLDVLKSSFERICELCWDAFGTSAFRPARSLNAAVLEAVMAELMRKHLSGEDLPDPNVLKQSYDQLISSSDFRLGWERATATEEAVKKRTEQARLAFS